MRLYTIVAMIAAAAALTFNFWHVSGVSSAAARPIVVDDMEPVVVEADDELTLLLRQEARTAIVELQRR